MVAYNKFNQFAADLPNKIHNFSSDQFNIALSNVAPVATNSIFGNITEIAAGNGYTAGGVSLTLVSSTQASGLYKYIASVPNPTWTATGNMATFQYVALYNFTQGAPVKPLVAWFDFGAPLAMTNTNTFAVVFDAANGVLQIS